MSKKYLTASDDEFRVLSDLIESAIRWHGQQIMSGGLQALEISANAHRNAHHWLIKIQNVERDQAEISNDCSGDDK